MSIQTDGAGQSASDATEIAIEPTSTAIESDPQFLDLKKELEIAQNNLNSLTEEEDILWSPNDAMTMSVAVLAFGAIVISIAAFSSAKRASLETHLRLYGTIMVITMAGFLVVAGFDKEQMAAPLGLLGTIAGYLLGQGSAQVTATRVSSNGPDGQSQ